MPERQRRAVVAHRVGIEERVAHLGRVVHRLDVTAPHLADLRGRPVLVEPPHDLGRGDQRVVGA